MQERRHKVPQYQPLIRTQSSMCSAALCMAQAAQQQLTSEESRSVDTVDGHGRELLVASASSTRLPVETDLATARRKASSGCPGSRGCAVIGAAQLAAGATCARSHSARCRSHLRLNPSRIPIESPPANRARWAASVRIPCICVPPRAAAARHRVPGGRCQCSAAKATADPDPQPRPVFRAVLTAAVSMPVIRAPLAVPRCATPSIALPASTGAAPAAAGTAP